MRKDVFDSSSLKSSNKPVLVTQIRIFVATLVMYSIVLDALIYRVAAWNRERLVSAFNS